MCRPWTVVNMRRRNWEVMIEGWSLEEVIEREFVWWRMGVWFSFSTVCLFFLDFSFFGSSLLHPVLTYVDMSSSHA